MATLVGTAGWGIARETADRFSKEGSSLARYAGRFEVTEINSSFHRSHRLSTWERWRDNVPAHFRFSAKLPKTVTHQRKLTDCADLVKDFLAEAHVLGEKLGILLVQLPPKLSFDPGLVRCFFGDLALRTYARVACEPRNQSWFNSHADALLTELKVARVAADPAICPAAAVPGGWDGLEYWRLHGSPVMYRSSYSDRIEQVALRLAERSAECWCIFDNTASSAATADALALASAVQVA